MAKVLELLRQFTMEILKLILGGKFTQGGPHETLSDFERGFHLDLSGSARVHDRQHPSHDSGEKVKRGYRDKNLRSEWAVIPKLLQHAL